MKCTRYISCLIYISVREICSRPTMWPCRHPEYCARLIDLLNGVQNCPDGSDEGINHSASFHFSLHCIQYISDPGYLDECYLGLSHCDKHAYCKNIINGAIGVNGVNGYECICVFGFQGNGTYCD